MTAPYTLTPAQPSDGLTTLQAWRREAALRLGAGEDTARHFGETGLLELDGKPLSLQPMSDRTDGPWIASLRAARPEGIGEGDWCDALLLATGQSLLALHAAFGLAEDGDAVLISRIPPGHDDPALLAAEVAGVLALRRAIVEGVGARLPADELAQELDAQPSPAPAAFPDAQAQGPDFDAPEEVLVLLHGSMLHLGRTAAQALAATRSGSLEIDGQPIGLACDADGENLIVAAALGAGVLDAASQRRAALMANTELMAFVGMAVARDRGQARLMSRWHVPGQSAENFAGWLREFARLARAITQRHTATASH